MKKLLPLTLALALAIPSALPARAASFPDVKETDWFYSYVTDLSDTGVVNGYPDGTFGPENLVRWDEALKLILLAAGESAQAPTGDGWASGYLTLAEEPRDITISPSPSPGRMCASWPPGPCVWGCPRGR